MEIKHVTSELAQHPDETFLNIVGFNEHTVGACSVTGESPVWEMHPDTDELFYILEGTFEITLWRESGPEHFTAPAGSTFVVPKGVWHKPAAPEGAKFMYFTPGASLHTEDPATA